MCGYMKAHYDSPIDMSIAATRNVNPATNGEDIAPWRPWEDDRRRKYHCTETNCGKTFTRRDNLTRHSKHSHSTLHSNKPKCKFCGKELSRKDSLKRHESTCPEKNT